MEELMVYKGFAIGDKVWDKEFGDSVIIGIDFKEKLLVTDKDMVGFDFVVEYLSKKG